MYGSGRDDLFRLVGRSLVDLGTRDDRGGAEVVRQRHEAASDQAGDDCGEDKSAQHIHRRPLLPKPLISDRETRRSGARHARHCGPC